MPRNTKASLEDSLPWPEVKNLSSETTVSPNRKGRENERKYTSLLLPPPFPETSTSPRCFELVLQRPSVLDGELKSNDWAQRTEPTAHAYLCVSNDCINRCQRAMSKQTRSALLVSRVPESDTHTAWPMTVDPHPRRTHRRTRTTCWPEPDLTILSTPSNRAGIFFPWSDHACIHGCRAALWFLEVTFIDAFFPVFVIRSPALHGVAAPSAFVAMFCTAVAMAVDLVCPVVDRTRHLGPRQLCCQRIRCQS